MSSVLRLYNFVYFSVFHSLFFSIAEHAEAQFQRQLRAQSHSGKHV